MFSYNDLSLKYHRAHVKMRTRLNGFAEVAHGAPLCFHHFRYATEGVLYVLGLIGTCTRTACFKYSVKFDAELIASKKKCGV